MDWSGWAGNTEDLISGLIIRNTKALDSGESLQNWLDYVRICEQMERLGLSKLTHGVECNEIEIDFVKATYQAAIFDLLAREILRDDPELSRFSGFSQEAMQDKFKEYDNKLKRLQCEQIAWKIDQSEIPTGNMGVRVSERTERFLLENECSKKTRHIPIRQLLLRASNALVALKALFYGSSGFCIPELKRLNI